MNTDINSVSVDDIFIPVLGLTGAGKSTFIENCINQNGPAGNLAGHGLESYTKCVTIHTTILGGQKVHLLDTPGFDDTYRSDVEVFQEMATWLLQAKNYGIKISGILYLHRITDTRLAGSARKALDVLKAMCGQSNYHAITFLTTKWDLLSKDPESRIRDEQRANQLMTNFWKDILDAGGEAVHLVPGTYSTRGLIETIVRKGSRVTLKIQKEMENNRMPISETSAGKVLFREYREQIELMEKRLNEAKEDLWEAEAERHDQDMMDARQHLKELNEKMAKQTSRMEELQRDIRNVVDDQMGKIASQREELELFIETSTIELQNRMMQSQQVSRVSYSFDTTYETPYERGQSRGQIGYWQGSYSSRGGGGGDGGSSRDREMVYEMARALIQKQKQGGYYENSGAKGLEAAVDARNNSIASRKFITSGRISAIAGVVGTAIALAPLCNVM